MKRIVLMVFMVMFLGMFIILGRAAAFNELDMKKLATTGWCDRCDLSGADLSKAYLKYTHLIEANLYDTRLTGAILRGANLSGANLSEAILTGADLTGANLSRANLRWATWTDGSKCGASSFGECKR